MLSFNFVIGLFIIALSSPEFKDAWNSFKKKKGNSVFHNTIAKPLKYTFKNRNSLVKRMNCQCNEG